MFTKEQFWPKNSGFLHHAYLIEGETAEILPKVSALVEETSGQKFSVNPDVYLIETDKFLIDQARDIRDKAWREPIGRGPKFFIIIVGSLTIEAAQAMLKIFEDPPRQTLFFLLVPSFSLILPTLRSRFFEISSARSGGGVSPASALAKKFIRSAPAERFSILEIFSGEEDEEAKDNSEQLRSFLTELEIFLLNQPSGLKYLNDLSLARKYLNDRSANLRLIFEHLAIVLPKYDF